MRRPAQFRVHVATGSCVVIRDVGPWDDQLSIGNDAKHVCTHLWNMFESGASTRFFYLDNEGEWTELMHDRGNFRAFRPADIDEILPLVTKGLFNIEEDAKVSTVHPDYEFFDRQARIREAMYDDNSPPRD